MVLKEVFENRFKGYSVFWDPWDLKKGHGFKPSGVQMKHLPTAWLGGTKGFCDLVLLLCFKRKYVQIKLLKLEISIIIRLLIQSINFDWKYWQTVRLLLDFILWKCVQLKSVFYESSITKKSGKIDFFSKILTCVSKVPTGCPNDCSSWPWYVQMIMWIMASLGRKLQW